MHLLSRFAPLKRSLKVADSPITGVDFSQLQATVTGSIKCFTSPCPEIAVSLRSQETVTVLSKGKISSIIYSFVERFYKLGSQVFIYQVTLEERKEVIP